MDNYRSETGGVVGAFLMKYGLLLYSYKAQGEWHTCTNSTPWPEAITIGCLIFELKFIIREYNYNKYLMDFKGGNKMHNR